MNIIEVTFRVALQSCGHGHNFFKCLKVIIYLQNAHQDDERHCISRIKWKVEIFFQLRDLCQP